MGPFINGRIDEKTVLRVKLIPENNKGLTLFISNAALGEAKSPQSVSPDIFQTC